MAGKVQLWTPERQDWLARQVAANVRASGRTDWRGIAGALRQQGITATAGSVQQAYQRVASEQGLPTALDLITLYRTGQPVPDPPARADEPAAPVTATIAPPPPPPEAPPPPPPVDPVVAEQERRERVRALREEKQALEAVAGEKSFRALLESVCRRYAPVLTPPPPYRPAKAPHGASQETIVQMLSDLHGGELVNREGTRGFNEFSTDILAQRLRQVIASHLSIKSRMERGGGWAFRRCVVALNGDLVSGTIHEIERHADTRNIIWAVFAVGHLVAQAIRDLAGQYVEVEVFCTSGNHGRLPDARRMQQKDPTRNWDTMVALFARAALATHTHVRWYIPNSYSVAYEVEGWTFCQTHGHDVKSWNSIPWYGLNRLVGNINALEASRGKTIHTWLFGHFHNPSSLAHASGESFINGSLIGGTEYTINALGKADKPCQWMLGVHPEHGVTFRFPLSGLGEGEGYEVPAEAMAA